MKYRVLLSVRTAVSDIAYPDETREIEEENDEKAMEKAKEMIEGGNRRLANQVRFSLKEVLKIIFSIYKYE